MAYGPAKNAWRELPPSGLSGNALDLTRRLAAPGSGRKDEIVGVDYLGKAVGYDRPTNSWRRLDDIPLAAGEGGPQIVDLGTEMIVRGYGGFAALGDNDQWTTLRTEYSSDQMAPVEGGLFVLGTQLANYFH
jgi:hypothetical protein